MSIPSLSTNLPDMARALVIVDIQNDYFPGGRCELVGPERAAERASSVLEGFRERGEPVFHVQHVWEGDDAEYLAPGTPGVEIHESVRPADGEPVTQKAYPNSFRETDLEQKLRDAGVSDLVIAGMMTSMCVRALKTSFARWVMPRSLLLPPRNTCAPAFRIAVSA